MHGDTKDNIRIEEFEAIYRHSYYVGDLGMCKWNLATNEMYISENITGYEEDFFSDMHEYLRTISFYKDKELALQDLDAYLKNKTNFYNSTFRVKTKEGGLRWVLFRGKIIKDEKSGQDILNVLMLNVTGDKFHEAHDIVTNLINERFFLRKLERSIELAKSLNKRGAIIYIDIDNFKTLVNNYGNQFINEFMLAFSQAVIPLLGKNYELAKLPGDKFIILIRDFDHLDEVIDMCNRIYDYFKYPLRIMKHHINVRLSMGVAVFPDDSSDPDELLQFCDIAKSHSKKLGKNICTFFDKKVSQAYFRKNLIENKLAYAIENDEFFLYFQPKVDIANLQIYSLEALLRWNNDDLGLVSPAEFIPIAERKGNIVDIGDWVLKETIIIANNWIKKGYGFDNLSINISPIQLKRRNFVYKLADLCSKYDIPHSKLEIEITEGTLMEATEKGIGILEELIDMGFKIAIDDFGTGYSNLRSLIEFEINTLKIDKSIVDNIENQKNILVLESIINLGKNLRFMIIAEGVETRKQLDILSQLGCNGIQGYYFYKPLPLNKIEDLLKRV